MPTALKIETFPTNGKVQSYGRNPDWIKIENADEPWLYACGIEGNVHLKLNPNFPLDGATVTLFFAELDETQPERSFDILLQGQVVEKDFKMSTAADGVKRGIKRSYKISGRNVVELKLKSASQDGPMPRIAGLEIKPSE